MCVAVGAPQRGRVLVGLEHSGCPVGIAVSTHMALVSTLMGVCQAGHMSHGFSVTRRVCRRTPSSRVFFSHDPS